VPFFLAKNGYKCCDSLDTFRRFALSGLESPMDSVQIEQKSYEMPPKEGISIAHFLTVADVERSARYYERSSALAF
jgi:hypothetical protein